MLSCSAIWHDCYIPWNEILSSSLITAFEKIMLFPNTKTHTESSNHHVEHTYPPSKSHLIVSSILSGYIKILKVQVLVPAEYAEQGSDRLCPDGCEHRGFTGWHWFMSPESLHIYQRDIFGAIDMWHHWRISFFPTAKELEMQTSHLVHWGNVYIPSKQTVGPVELVCMSFLKHYYVYFLF